MYSFPNVEPAHCSVSILTFASWPAYRFLRRQVRRSGILVSLRNFPQFDVIHTVKGFGLVNIEEIDFFFFSWNSLAFFMFQRMLAIGYLVPLTFLNPPWTSGSSWFMYYWNLAGTILSISLVACEMSAIVWYSEHSLALPFFGGWNEKWPFPVLWPLLSFPNLLAYSVQHFNGIIF